MFGLPPKLMTRMFPDASSLPGLFTVHAPLLCRQRWLKTSEVLNNRLGPHCAVYKIGFVISSGDDDLYSDQGPSDRADHHDACGQLCCDTVENKSKMKSSLLFVFILQLDIHIQLNIFINDK